MKTLVIIDDEVFFRKSLINFLEKQNLYNIAGEANNGQAGIRLIENVKPDIALGYPDRCLHPAFRYSEPRPAFP